MKISPNPLLVHFPLNRYNHINKIADMVKDVVQKELKTRGLEIVNVKPLTDDLRSYHIS